MTVASPVELAQVQVPSAQPDSQAIVDQHLHAVAVPVGKQVSTVRERRTEDLHRPGQRRVQAGPHIQGIDGQPNSSMWIMRAALGA